MPFDFEKRHIRTIGSSQDFKIWASAFTGLLAAASAESYSLVMPFEA